MRVAANQQYPNVDISSEDISKALLIIGIGVFTYLSVLKAVNRVAKQIFEKNSSTPQLSAIVISSAVVMQALLWESSTVQLCFSVILLGYVVERVAFFIWVKNSASNEPFWPEFMYIMGLPAATEEENVSMLGHEAIIDQITTHMNWERKTNAILLGLPGVGKTAVARNFATKMGKKLIASHGVFGKAKVIKIDFKTLLGGMKVGETLEDRINKIIKMGMKYQFIYFIDRDDSIVNGGRLEYHITLLKRLLPFTENGPIRILATLTLEEYEVYFKSDPLARLMNIITVQSATPTQCFNMLRFRYQKLNQSEDFKMTDRALAAAVFFSGSVFSRQYPDKAIDLIEYARATANLEKKAGQVIIDVDQIAKSCLTLYKLKFPLKRMVQEYKDFLDNNPNFFPGLKNGESKWVLTQHLTQ